MWRLAFGQGMLSSGIGFNRKPHVGGGRKPRGLSQEREEVNLVKGDTAKVTKVGTRLNLVLKSKIVEFLKQNLDVFTWTHEDMPGINNEAIEHKLNVVPTKKLI